MELCPSLKHFESSNRMPRILHMYSVKEARIIGAKCGAIAARTPTVSKEHEQK